jgi:hypothetical protein
MSEKEARSQGEPTRVIVDLELLARAQMGGILNTEEKAAIQKSQDLVHETEEQLRAELRSLRPNTSPSEKMSW